MATPGILFEDPDVETPVGDTGSVINVVWFGARGDGETDDSDAFDAAINWAGPGGTILVPQGTWRVADISLQQKQRLVGTGLNSVLKAFAGATWVVRIQSKQGVLVEGLTIDGNARASGGILLQATNSVLTCQRNRFDRVVFTQCSTGMEVSGTTNVPPSDQVDKNAWNNCHWVECDTGLYLNSTNAQLQRLFHFDISSCTVGIRARHGTLTLDSGDFQFNANGQTGVLMDGVNLDWVGMYDVWAEGFPNCKVLDGVSGDVHGWPVCGVNVEMCTFADIGIDIGTIGGGGTTSTLVARNCRLRNVPIVVDVAEAVFRDEYNSIEGTTALTLVGSAATYFHRHRWTYQGYWHYLGSNLVAHLNTSGDYVSNSSAVGLVLKSPDGHFWRSAISNAGVLTFSDVGTTLPEF